MWRKTYIYQRSFTGFGIRQLNWFMPVSEQPIKMKYRAARLRLLAPYYASNIDPIAQETITVDKWTPAAPIVPRKRTTYWLTEWVNGDPNNFETPTPPADVSVDNWHSLPAVPRFRNRVDMVRLGTESVAFDPFPDETTPTAGEIRAVITVKSSQGLV